MRDLLTTPMETIEADFEALQRTISRSSVFQTSKEPDATIYWSHLPLAGCNVIVNARIAATDVGERAPQLLQPFLDRGLPFQWVTTPDTTTPALEAALAQAGLVPHESVAMHVNLDQPIDPRTPDDVFIDVVWPDKTEPVAATIFAGLGMDAGPDAWHLHFLDTIDPADHQFFIARSMFNGDAVGASTAHRRGNSVMLANVTTLHSARGKGIDHALTGTMMNRARETGAVTATLISTPDSYPAFIELGFRTGLNVVTWRWEPDV